MSSSPQPHRHPLKFLLHLEWVLLAIVGVSELFGFRLFQLPHRPLLNLLGLSVFAGLGLRLPNRPSAKVGYTCLEFGLILLTSLAGGIRLFPLLYIVLVIRNCLVFEGYNRSFVSGVALLLCVLTLSDRMRYLGVFLSPMFADRIGVYGVSLTILFGLVILFLQQLVNAILAERLSREQLAAANEKLRQYAMQVEDTATLQERNRIAREIHDSLGHSLTVFNLHLEAALRLFHANPTEAQELLAEAKQIASKALQEVRQSVSALRSDPLQGRSLTAAISTLIDDFQRSTDIQPTCQMDINRALSTEVKTAVYRIVQESLTNIYKYAAATNVHISITSTPDLKVIVQDNGKGFESNQIATGFGLQGMRERTLAAKGSFELVTKPAAGCQIIARFPL